MSKDAKPIETRALGMIYKPGLFQKPRVGLRKLTLTIEPGEIFGYLGANGAGKTTTLKILVGLLFPTGGSATLYGRDIGDPESRRALGFLPENPYFYEYLTAEESLLFYGRLAGLTRAEARARTGPLLERVGLAKDADVRVRGFSKGMRQRLGLAQAILHDPPLVILDEPMSGLDPRGRRDVRDLMVALREEGKTIFFSSHILPDVETIADRVGMLREGRLVTAGPLHEIVRPQVTGIEVVCEGAGEDVATKAGVRPQRVRLRAEGGVIFDLDSETDADRVVAAVYEAGGRVVSMTPQTETLEDVFLRIAVAAPADPGGETEGEDAPDPPWASGGGAAAGQGARAEEAAS